MMSETMQLHFIRLILTCTFSFVIGLPILLGIVMLIQEILGKEK